MAGAFLSEARATYVDINAGNLDWMLARPRLHGAFLNTKVNSITLADYDRSDGWRSPDFIYGWIQGRGLEALVSHAAFFENEDPALAARLLTTAEPLYRTLRDLHDAHGHGYFVYDGALEPVSPGEDGAPRPSQRTPDLFTFADIFVAKGLLTAARRFDTTAVDGDRRRLVEIAAAIEDGRFVEEHANADGDPVVITDYGPRMILLGAAPMLDVPDTAFASRFIDYVLKHNRAHTHAGAVALSDHAGQDLCNPGHAIEFAGYGLEAMVDANDPRTADLNAILLGAFELGFEPPGICLSVSLSTGAPASSYYPWWPLPEAIGAAAAAYRRSRDPAVLDLWQRAHAAFLTNYWRADAGLAYQTRDANGPIDYVPATPDLDPGYHTGLSLLRAICAIDAVEYEGQV
ncbi:MAG: hypothetical protein GY798_27905 [Hyphomicrobiales bacterium]|nr:hypothetical protein [Hyphomicrobiales bacterium]